MEKEQKRSKYACCAGGSGACLCTTAMIAPLIIGGAGAGMSAMSAMGAADSGGFIGLLNTFNSTIGQPAFVLSMILIVYGMRYHGNRPLVLSAVGGGLLYLSMYVIFSLPLVAISGMILAASYVLAFLPHLDKKEKK